MKTFIIQERFTGYADIHIDTATAIDIDINCDTDADIDKDIGICIYTDNVIGSDTDINNQL